MTLRWGMSAATIAVVCLIQLAASLSAAKMDWDELTDNEITDYFGGITTFEAKKGSVNYDIVDLWDQPGESSTRAPLRTTGPHRPHHDVHFTAFQENFHLRLRQNPWLVREGLTMDTLGPSGTLVSSKKVDRSCYYLGDVASHPIGSTLALSKCNGLSGMIAYGNHSIYIKPLRSDHAERYRRRRREAVDPHIVYRRSAEDGDPSAEFCSTPPPMLDIATGMTVEEEMTASLRGKLLPSSLQTSQKYMELMVMADNDMRKYHEDELETYVLTILNIVARRFVDPSLGANLRIHLVKFYVLDSDQVGSGSDGLSPKSPFQVTNDGYALLDDFCQWQGDANKGDDIDPEHWDNAMLLTRKNLINPTDGSDSLLGRAPVGGTCRHFQQCSVNQDDGLGSALTVSHETGHTLNLKHDSSYGCPDGVNIMSGLRSAGEGALSWSMCSYTNIQEFLRNPVSDCLNDEPLIAPLSVNELPGTTHSYADQCRLAFDSDRYTKPVNDEVDCSALACQDPNGSWRSSASPVMEGTECGLDKWCISGRCVDRVALPDAVDGQWSSWDAAFGPCSRTCGGGLRSKMRYCNNPPPSNGGRGCKGENVKYSVCEMQSCTTSQDDFRNEQCVATNGVPFNGAMYNWFKAYTDGQTGDELCQHQCLNEQRFYAKREPFQFVDGTRCWHDESDDLGKLKLCVSGQCESFGCDGRKDSGAKFDVCGVCEGDGSSCVRVSDSFSGGTATGFVRFLTLPVGSTSVEISNSNSRFTYIALSIGGEYILRGDGNYRPSSGRYSAGASVVLYASGSAGETVHIAGPTADKIRVDAHLLYDPTVNYAGGTNVRPDVRYEYYRPGGSDGTVPQSFSWVKTAFGACSATCGGGTQTRSVTCRRTVNAREETADDALCPLPKPGTSQACNGDMCPREMPPASWETSQWFPCSVTCGEGRRTRMVTCVRDGVEMKGDGGCDATAKPAVAEVCQPGDCSQVPSVCDGVMDAPSGTINTIGRQTAGTTCTQIIAAPPGKDVILTILKLVIDCDTESFSVSARLRRKTSCGYLSNLQLTVRHNIVKIEHSASGSTSGYHISYSLVDSVTPPNPCDRVLTGDSDRITSPNWPSPYGPSQTCTTTIVVRPGKRVRLIFQKFLLEGEEPACSKDYVSVTDNYSRQESPVIYCGTKSRFTFVSESNLVALTFRSDASASQSKGFKARVRQIN